MDATECNERGKAFRESLDAGRFTFRSLFRHLARWVNAESVTEAEAYAIADATDRFGWVYLQDAFPLVMLPTYHAVRKFAEANGIELIPHVFGQIHTKRGTAQGSFQLVPFATMGTESDLL